MLASDFETLCTSASCERRWEGDTAWLISTDTSTTAGSSPAMMRKPFQAADFEKELTVSSASKMQKFTVKGRGRKSVEEHNYFYKSATSRLSISSRLTPSSKASFLSYCAGSRFDYELYHFPRYD